MTAQHNSTIANQQEHFCYKIANSISANHLGMETDKELIEGLIEHTGISASEIARKAGLAVTTLTRPLNKPVNYQLSKRTIDQLKKTFPDFPGFRSVPDLPEVDPTDDYVPVEVLPVHAGMGGGGLDYSDSKEREVALLPRVLIKDVLRGKPSDFLLINVRGDSMEPDFRHGDQILVDCRDRSPAQPGPFALWDGEWGEYVVKNVERSQAGEVRIFSSNPKYTSEAAPAETTRIIGRPVWFGRRL